jgi:RNA polymerase sigma-54 factor
MVRELRGYDPKPGCQFVSKEPEAITPDVFVRKSKGGWMVELNNAALPRLLVNRRYYTELKSGPQDKQSKAWLSECLAEANWLVKALDQRARTIVKVATEIVRQQQGFFEQGVAALKPLTLAKVADAIEMHESTVSRVTSNKYIACDRGMFELKYFFGSGVASEGGEAQRRRQSRRPSSRSSTKRPRCERRCHWAVLPGEGMDAARRTVVKHREAMGTAPRSSAAGNGRWSWGKPSHPGRGLKRHPRPDRQMVAGLARFGLA